MILMRGIHITRGIGRVVLKVEPENQDFLRGPRFFGPIKWHEAPAECHFRAQKIEGPLKR